MKYKSVLLTEEYYDLLKQLADEQHRPVANYLRMLIIQEISKSNFTN
jgi:predicted DNA-binding protein